MPYKVNSKKLLFVFILLLYVLYMYSLFSLGGGYYSIEDFFGPLSKSSYIAISLILFLVFSFIYIYMNKDSNNSNYISLLIIILVALSKFLVPDIADSYYDQNFYDAGGHMVRGAFVTLTGHSDPNIDGYFDLQPAFFWVTAVFINIVYGSPLSPSDPIFGFLVKWFNIIAIMIYIPILYLLFKKYGLKKGEAYLAFFLFFGLSFGRFHYAAQTYGNALFWLSLALVPDIIKHYDIKKILTLLPILTSIIFLHEGLTIFTSIALASILIALAFPRASKKSSQNVFILLFIFSITWFLFLLYVSKFTLSNFVNTFISIVKVYLIEGTTKVVEGGLTRPWQPWANVVFFKAIFMALIILATAFTSLELYIKLRGKIYKVTMFIIFGITVFLGLVAAALGGAGYIERIPLVLLPLIAVTFVESMSRERFSSNHKKVIATIALCLVIMGLFAFFSGRNFQSSTYGEHYAYFYSVAYSPKDSYGIYTNLNILTLNTAITFKLLNESMGVMYVGVSRSAIINTLYYTYGDITKITIYVNELILEKNIVFMDSDYMLLT